MTHVAWLPEMDNAGHENCDLKNETGIYKTIWKYLVKSDSGVYLDTAAGRDDHDDQNYGSVLVDEPRERSFLPDFLVVAN